MVLRSLLYALLLATAAGTAAAERLVVEVIPIGYRSAEELASILRPLVPPPGSVSGMQGQLVVKTTPENLTELKRVLAELDRAPRTLLISVRRGLSAATLSREDEARVRVEHGDASGVLGQARRGPGATARLGDDDVQARLHSDARDIRSTDEAIQRIRVLEGTEAFISAGQSVPYGSRRVIVSGGVARVQGGVAFHDVTSGFYVIPRVHGEQVLLALSPHSARLTARGAVRVEEASTTVSGRLGEWIPVGGVDESAYRTHTGVLSRSETRSARRSSLYVKVEVVD